MEFGEYQRQAARTIPADHDRATTMDAAIMGMIDELGELTGPWKKHRHQGHPAPDVEHQAEELGDLLWYLNEAATAMGLSLEGIAQKNLEKLIGKNGRYPEGHFDPARSIHREDPNHA